MNQGDQNRFVHIHGEDAAYFAACGLTSWPELVEASRPSKQEHQDTTSILESTIFEENDETGIDATTIAAAAALLMCEDSSPPSRPPKKPRVQA